jgi:signal transduction histidine kinase
MQDTTSARVDLVFNRYRSVVLVAGGLVVLVALAVGAGMLIEELRRSVEEQRVIHNSRQKGRELVERIAASYGMSGSLTGVGLREWKRFETEARGLMQTNREIAYLDLIDRAGRIVWSTDALRAGQVWEGGEPGPFLGGLQQRFHGPGGGDDREAIFLELVTAVPGRPESPGALIVGLSEAGIAEQLRKAYWRTLALLGGTGLIAFGGFAVAYRTLMRRRVALTRRISHDAHLAEMGLLAAGLAHELRNPLNAVRFALASLEDRARRVGDSPAGRGIADLHGEIAAEVEDLERIVRAFLEYARPAAHDAEECDLEKLCESALAVAAPRAKQRGVELRLALPGGSARIRLARVGVRQVLVNLLANAVEACDAGRHVTLTALRETSRLRLVVEDDGPGVPEKIRARLFEPFVTAGQGGTGLGLAMCRRIVSEMGGSIDYERRRPTGSIFTVALPLEAPVAMRRVAV